MKKIVSLLLCLMLLVSVTSAAFAEEAAVATQEIVWDENGETILLENGAEYGEGEKTFALVVSCLNETAAVAIHTDADTIGAALLELNIIAGEDSEWGLYVKTVNGITADYNTDGTYWAFYIDGEYAMTGVDATEINEESVYVLVVDGLTVEEGATIPLHDGKNYGIGEKVFAFQVIAAEDDVITVSVCTNAETVGAALAELQMIAGEDSEYGLYVKTINNVTADYNTDGTYWAFYIDGEYAMTGVDATEITEGAVYTFAISK